MKTEAMKPSPVQGQAAGSESGGIEYGPNGVGRPGISASGQRKSRRGERAGRRGASAVEMAIILPLLLLMIFGMIELGRAIMVHQILVNAAREATRRAVVPGATDAQVHSRISNYMSSAGISGYTVSLTIDGTASTLSGSSSSITNAPSKSAIGIEISVPNSEVSWGVMNLIASNRNFAAGVQMRKE